MSTVGFNAYTALNTTRPADAAGSAGAAAKTGDDKNVLFLIAERLQLAEIKKPMKNVYMLQKKNTVYMKLYLNMINCTKK